MHAALRSMHTNQKFKRKGVDKKMANKDIIMPKLGFSEGDLTLSKWLKAEGDEIKQGDAIAEVESDKITNNIEAETDGKIVKLCVAEGDEVSIGDVIAVIDA